MQLSKISISSHKLTAFQTFLMSDQKVKKISKEFDFYNVHFYKEEKSKSSTISLEYPKGNLYWYLDFEKYINEIFINCEVPQYVSDWNNLLARLKVQIKNEYNELKYLLDSITAHNIVMTQYKYNLRDYQAYDLLQFILKYNYWGNKGLILSDPRTGKSRVALAAAEQILNRKDVCLIVCPKSAQIGWASEINFLNSIIDNIFNLQIVSKISDLKTLELSEDKINCRLVSYDIFKKLTLPQVRQILSKSKNVLFIGDEIHRLRNFSTQQSKAIFNFKEICYKDKVNLGIIGLTGTPAVKETYDVFGTLCLINDSKIEFKPHYSSFNCFKEYFYYCEDTSFGKEAKALKREHELAFLMQLCSVQTKQHVLKIFKDYKKEYVKINLKMDNFQKEIYTSVFNDMEYDDNIDCQNKLVQLIRLQQICIDPFGLVPSYERLSPKLKYIVNFAKKNSSKFIVMCKKSTPLKHLMEVLKSEKIEYASILGNYTFNERSDQVYNFRSNKNVKCFILQSDTGKEALTLPEADVTIFLDRDFAQGNNIQAEARMTPLDGKPHKKYIIDLVMEDTKEEEIYNTLVVKKQSIDAVNLVFKPKEI